MKISNPIAVLGENAAVSYLTSKGYKILDRNFRKGYGEIDIVALKDNVLVFIEVKSRTSMQFGAPRESITYFKLQSLVKSAEFYKHTHTNLPDSMRIDAIFISIQNGKVTNLEHVENITGF